MFDGFSAVIDPNPLQIIIAGMKYYSDVVDVGV